jgi:hypothetical protein
VSGLACSLFAGLGCSTCALLHTFLQAPQQHYSSVLSCRVPYLHAYDNITPPYATVVYFTCMHTTTLLFRTLLLCTLLVCIRQQYSSVLYCCVLYLYTYDKSSLPYSTVVYCSRMRATIPGLLPICWTPCCLGGLRVLSWTVPSVPHLDTFKKHSDTFREQSDTFRERLHSMHSASSRCCPWCACDRTQCVYVSDSDAQLTSELKIQHKIHFLRFRVDLIPSG